MKAVKTLVLLANDEHARIFENLGIGKGLAEIEAALPADEVRYSDFPGRSSAGVGEARHGLDRSSSEEDQARNAYAAVVLAEVDARWRGGSYDRFVMAAPPKMLGVLRSKLSKPLGEALEVDLNKDLLSERAEDLAGHFADRILF